MIFLSSLTHCGISDKMNRPTITNGSDRDDNGHYHADAYIATPELSAETHTVKFTPCTIRFFVLRLADPNEDWRIQALFGDQMKYEFKKTTILAPAKVSKFI
jgi:hypothetical protein